MGFDIFVESEGFIIGDMVEVVLKGNTNIGCSTSMGGIIDKGTRSSTVVASRLGIAVSTPANSTFTPIGLHIPSITAYTHSKPTIMGHFQWPEFFDIPRPPIYHLSLFSPPIRNCEIPHPKSSPPHKHSLSSFFSLQNQPLTYFFPGNPLLQVDQFSLQQSQLFLIAQVAQLPLQF